MIQKEVFIKCKGLPYDVIAKVMKIRKNTGSAFLTSFHYVIITAERRVCVRVRVSDKVDATFHFNNRLIQGRIEDISFSGISITTPKGITLEENSTGTVHIALPTTMLELSGKLLKVNQDDSTAKFIIELEMDNKSEQCISQFIFAQQSVIIRELKRSFRQWAGHDHCLNYPEIPLPIKKAGIASRPFFRFAFLTGPAPGRESGQAIRH